MHRRKVMEELLPKAALLAQDLFDHGWLDSAELVRLMIYVIETELAPTPASAKADEARTERYLSE